MSKRLSDPKEMRMIYEKSKDVFDNKYAIAYAIRELSGKVHATPSSIKMYFEIYSCMRKAKCYKMGTGEKFTKFLLNNIFLDNGVDDYIKALSAVKANYVYRESVNNTQPTLIRACRESIDECKLDLAYEDVPMAGTEEENKDVMDFIEVYHEKQITSIEAPIINSNNLLDNKELGDIEENEHYFENDTIELNIQPPASILNVFSRLSYKPWYAIAEFVDNSTQSYISHSKELNSLPDFDKLIVDVKYDAQKNTLTVKDNAYGMEIDRFRDAILLDSRNETQTGRNEFGMGLKTAASWFGKKWTVSSTQYGSNNKYTATVDIPRLDEFHLQGTVIHREHVSSESHGTEIYIEQVTKKIIASRTIGKIRDLLSSMYRRDINNNNIEICFNGEPIVFEEYPILTNFRGKSWKKDLDFTVEFDNCTYHVTGFVAIMNPGSFAKAGFALFRQDRVVIGGNDSNYKPVQIFGQAQSQKSLKLFGELNMNDFPVNQAKDGFIWDDGLEDAFIMSLRDNIQEYLSIAEMSIKERANEMQFSDEASSELQQTVSNTIDAVFGNESNCIQESQNTNYTTQEENNISYVNEVSEQSEENGGTDISEYIDTVLNAKIEEECVSTIREYNVPLSPVEKICFFVQWSRVNKKYWIEYNSENDDNSFKVFINIDHPFFMPFTKADGFQKVLEKFAIAFILAERQAKLGSDKQGYIQTSTIKNYMNRFLEKLAEDQ